MSVYYKLYHFHHKWYYGLKAFFTNIFVFRKALFTSRPWDYHGLLVFMRIQLSVMEKSIREHGIHLNKDNHCKRMRECIELLKRIEKDDYFKAEYDWKDGHIEVIPLYDYPKNHKVISAFPDKQKKNDVERLFYLLNKYMMHFWD